MKVDKFFDSHIKHPLYNSHSKAHDVGLSILFDILIEVLDPKLFIEGDKSTNGKPQKGLEQSS